MTKAFKDLKSRFLFSCVTVAVSSMLVIWSAMPLVQLLLVLLIALFTGVGVWELSTMLKLKGLTPMNHVIIPFGVLLMLSFYAAHTSPMLMYLPVAVFVIGTIILFIRTFDAIDDGFLNVGMSFFSVCYVAIPLGMVCAIVLPSSTCFGVQDGRLWVTYLIVVTFMTDIGGYFGGKIWGKKKLAPKLSPKKTVAGALIGLVSAMTFSFLFFILSSALQSPAFNLGFLQSLYLGLLLGFFGQIGDLAESLIKRDAGVKDSNKLPGVGGVLDFLDATLFTAPILYLFLYVCG